MNSETPCSITLSTLWSLKKGLTPKREYTWIPVYYSYHTCTLYLLEPVMVLLPFYFTAIWHILLFLYAAF